MTLPTSGAITFSQLQAEFGGSNPIGLSEYYGGAGFVPPGITGSGGAIPSSGSPQLMSRFRDNGFRGITTGGIEGGSTYLSVATYLNIIGITQASFGTMTTQRWSHYSFGSSTRFIACGGYAGAGAVITTSCETSLFANSGSFSAFGSTASAANTSTASGSNRTRGINFGGFDGSAYNQTTFIGYKDLTTSGGTNSFGLLNVSRGKYSGAADSPTKTYVILGSDSFGGPVTSIEYVTTATTGNATVYGQTDSQRAWHAQLSSSTRAVYGGGLDLAGTGLVTATLRYFEMSTSSATAAFGNLTQARSDLSSLSGGTRGIFTGGDLDGGARSAVMDYINIASTGNAASFGSLANAAGIKASSANGHGGLM